MFCPKCGQKLPEGARFCGSCGAQIVSAQPVRYAATQSAPQYAPANNAQYVPHTVLEPKRSPLTWPPVIGILMVFAFLFSIAFIVFYCMFFIKYMGASTGGIIVQIAVTLTCGMLAIILFFVPTRRVPAVTSIPRWIALLYSIISIVALFNQMRSAAAANLVTFFLFTLSPVILYTVGTAAKPRTVTIAVIHLVLVVLAFIVTLFSFEWRMWPQGSNARTYLLLYILLEAVASLISGIAYTIALFFSRRKYYPEKQ